MGRLRFRLYLWYLWAWHALHPHTCVRCRENPKALGNDRWCVGCQALLSEISQMWRDAMAGKLVCDPDFFGTDRTAEPRRLSGVRFDA